MDALVEAVGRGPRVCTFPSSPIPTLFSSGSSAAIRRSTPHVALNLLHCIPFANNESLRTVSSLGSKDVTRLLNAIEQDEPLETVAGVDLFERVYDELRALAHQHRTYWSGNDTLNTTALVHEAYLKMEGSDARFESRAHFLAVASKAMRHVLISYARAQSAEKRGGQAPVLPLDEASAVPGRTVRFGELVALDHVLRDLQRVKPRAARIIECRFFGGMTIDETADALDLSASTVTRTWRTAQAWLYRRLRDDLPSETSDGSPQTDDASRGSNA